MMKTLILMAAIFSVSATSFAQTEVKRYPYLQMVSAANPLAWKMKKAKWSEQDEADFGAFIQRIGLAAETHKCNNFVSCLTNPEINPLVKSDPQGLRYFADCADVPYWLRIYFAWKKGLPMSVITNTAPRDPNDPKAENRNETISGNVAIQRTDSVAVNGKFPLITQFLSSTTEDGLILDSVSSGTYRMPIVPNADEPLSDFYPIPIKRSSIKPGTIVYTADGHVAIVYKVDADGNIRTLNGNPADKNASNTPLKSRDYNDTFKRSRQEHGSILKNFRPVELVGATPDAQGNLIGGSIVMKPNSEISDASIEQAKLKFASSNEYFLFVRKRLAQGTLQMNVITEFKRTVKNACDFVQQREELVNGALNAGMDSKSMVVAPRNIFSDKEDWENYSTPSKDVNIRAAFKQIMDNLKISVAAVKRGDKLYSYAGSNLGKDLYDTYKTMAFACTISYNSRTGQTRTLNLEQVHSRMYKISFDPYHCADLRWGDSQTGLQACSEDVRWYNAEQYLRNMMEKVPGDQEMTVDQMERKNAASAAASYPNTDFVAYIKSLQ